ncbi:MAG: iron-containing alcohol dehydrogenase family protein [Spirochaetaceae bacterium]|jgi:glycerol-1-phosphate dehydrogenase [NAD(P)+]|nr:iron-containing alcohol dehydrogenase family protein [Spirochaetaceae bacterium]
MEISIPTLLRIKPNALHKLGKYLRKQGFFKVALFYGEGMAALLGERISISLDSSEVNILHQEDIFTNDVDTILETTFNLPKGIEAIVAVGGGKAIDYSKYVAFILQLPIITVPTSISNDGFASPGASLEVNKRRRSLKAKIPYGVVIDTTVIQNAPEALILSGIGDLVSKYTAIHDWKLSYHNTGEPVNDFAVLISLNSVDNMVRYNNCDIHDLEFLRLICGSLVMSGVAMEVSGSSRPASGSEHLLSHAYDRLAEKPSLHGIQVGVATYAIGALQQNPNQSVVSQLLENCGFFNYVTQNPLDKKIFIDSVKLAPSIKQGYYTILSQEGKTEELLGFVEDDPWMKKLLV